MIRSLLAVACVGVLGSVALAQTGPELVIDPMNRTRAEADLAVTAMGNAGTNSPGHEVNVWRTEGDFKIKLDPFIHGDPLSQPTTQPESQGWTFENVRVGYQETWLHLDTTHPGLPNNLRDESVGMAFVFYRDTEWKLSGGLAVGYAGNNLYADEKAAYAKADLMAEHKIDDKSSIQVSLDYNGNRTFMPDVPLPGIAYLRELAPNVTCIIGLPVSSIEWKPCEKVTLSAEYLMFEDFAIGARYELTKQIGLNVQFSTNTDAFQYNDNKTNDRLFYSQQTLEASLDYTPIDALTLSVAAGYAFNQSFYTGFDDRHTDEVTDLADVPYIRIGASFRF